MREKERRMNEPYDPNKPIELQFDQIEDAIDHATAGNSAFTPRQIVNTGHYLAFDTGFFRDEFKVWHKLEEENLT